jgi:hypothetical protein
MNRPRSFEQRLEAWLEEGPASAPPDLLDQVLVSVPPDSPRRRRFGAARRLSVLSSTARFGAAVAAVLVIGVVGFSLIMSKAPSIGGVGATPTPSAAATSVPTSGGPAACLPANLAARIVSWDGAAGSRTASVVLKNTGAEQCITGAVDRPQLVGGDGTVLIDGAPVTGTAGIILAAGQTVTTLAQAGNYCGDIPTAPITLAFVLSVGSGRVVATPVSMTDTSGLPPCNGAGSAATIDMHPWAP